MTIETQTEKTLQEMVVYADVPSDLVIWNRYMKGNGLKPTFRFVAEQYGCKVEFRVAKFKEDPYDQTSYCHGPQDGDELTALVLIGEDRAKLAQARNDIYRTFGGTRFDHGRAEVTSEKSGGY